MQSIVTLICFLILWNEGVISEYKKDGRPEVWDLLSNHVEYLLFKINVPGRLLTNMRQASYHPEDGSTWTGCIQHVNVFLDVFPKTHIPTIKLKLFTCCHRFSAEKDYTFWIGILNTWKVLVPKFSLSNGLVNPDLGFGFKININFLVRH